MPRHPRVAPGGLVYHALNRATARLPLFEKDADFEAFERCIEYAQERDPTRILGYCVGPIIGTSCPGRDERTGARKKGG